MRDDGPWAMEPAHSALYRGPAVSGRSCFSVQMLDASSNNVILLSIPGRTLIGHTHAHTDVTGVCILLQKPLVTHTNVMILDGRMTIENKR